MRHGGGWDGTVVKWVGVKNEARLRRSEMGIWLSKVHMCWVFLKINCALHMVRKRMCI